MLIYYQSQKHGHESKSMVLFSSTECVTSHVHMGVRQDLLTSFNINSLHFLWGFQLNTMSSDYQRFLSLVFFRNEHYSPSWSKMERLQSSCLGLKMRLEEESSSPLAI